MAEFMTRLSALQVPQRIGSTFVHEDGTMTVTPLISVYKYLSAKEVFDDLDGYIAHIFHAKRGTVAVVEDENIPMAAFKALSRLESLIETQLRHLSSETFRRCVLNHDDMNCSNILVDEHGNIAGVIDWEYHSTLPIVLAARFPRWIRYDGVADPDSLPPEGDGSLWQTDRENASKLCALYSQVCL